METLTLQRPGRFTASSSQRVEDLVGPSGLPPQASIAGCQSLRGQLEEWGALLERVGQELSRVEELPSQIPTLREEILFKELVSVLLGSGWIGRGGHPHSCIDWVYLTSAHHGSGMASAGGQVYLIQLKPTGPEECEAGTSGERGSKTWEPVIADTDRAYTVQQMAQAWKAIAREVTEDDVPLSVDPDDYPLF